MSSNKEEILKQAKARYIEQLNSLTGQVSTQVRTISVGVLALCWALIIQSPSQQSISIKPEDLILPIVFALCALLADALQYLFGYSLNLKMLRYVERHIEGRLDKYEIDVLRNTLRYNERELLYRLRQGMFSLKVLATFASTLCLILILALVYIELL